MLTSLESRVTDLLIPHAGIHEDLLRAQLRSASVDRRLKDKTGFFAYFTISVRETNQKLPDMILSGIQGKHPSLEHGVDFILFIKNGVVSVLEAYTLAGEPWPLDEDKMALQEVYLP